MFILFSSNTQIKLQKPFLKNLFWLQKMPLFVFGSTSGITKIKTDTSSFVQKPCLRTNYIESNDEENYAMENQFKI